jgi:hypothetical protein
MRVDDEIFEELAVAVFAGDLEKAEALLGELHAISGDFVSEMIRRAKRKARPEMKVSLPPSRPMVLPVPGHLPGSTMSRPITAEDVAVV